MGARSSLSPSVHIAERTSDAQARNPSLSPGAAPNPHLGLAASTHCHLHLSGLRTQFQDVSLDRQPLLESLPVGNRRYESEEGYGCNRAFQMTHPRCLEQDILTTPPRSGAGDTLGNRTRERCLIKKSQKS